MSSRENASAVLRARSELGRVGRARGSIFTAISRGRFSSYPVFALPSRPGKRGAAILCGRKDDGIKAEHRGEGWETRAEGLTRDFLRAERRPIPGPKGGGSRRTRPRPRESIPYLGVKGCQRSNHRSIRKTLRHPRTVGESSRETLHPP